jgi:hypothetical protein
MMDKAVRKRLRVRFTGIFRCYNKEGLSAKFDSIRKGLKCKPVYKVVS